jgi:hypothetical protein
MIARKLFLIAIVGTTTLGFAATEASARYGRGSPQIRLNSPSTWTYPSKLHVRTVQQPRSGRVSIKKIDRDVVGID